MLGSRKLIYFLFTFRHIKNDFKKMLDGFEIFPVEITVDFLTHTHTRFDARVFAIGNVFLKEQG